jgi:hypothetical protein
MIAHKEHANLFTAPSTWRRDKQVNYTWVCLCIQNTYREHSFAGGERASAQVGSLLCYLFRDRIFEEEEVGPNIWQFHLAVKGRKAGISRVTGDPTIWGERAAVGWIKPTFLLRGVASLTGIQSAASSNQQISISLKHTHVYTYIKICSNSRRDEWMA